MEHIGVNLNEIINLSGVHPLKIRNVYIYGSRVYGTYKPDSDFDIIIVSGSLLDHTEIKNDKYNIHIHTPDKFKQDLNNYIVHCLECFYAPITAKLQEKEKYEDFKIIPAKFKQSILTQSSNTWTHAKYKFNTGDIHRGLKSGFHAIKALEFGIQILENGSIVNFASNNDLLREIMGSEYYDWKPFKEKYLSLKIEFENKLKAI